MISRFIKRLLVVSLFLSTSVFINPVPSQETEEIRNLDEKVKKPLETHRGKWVDWNVPGVDGKVLHDLIIKNNYTKALEIGTSTGHSAIWIAWALSKTGGKLAQFRTINRSSQEGLSISYKRGEGRSHGKAF